MHLHKPWVVIASGPSLTQADVDYLKGKTHVVTVNTSFRAAPWADAHYSNDDDWFDTYLPELRETAQGRLICGFPGYQADGVEVWPFDKESAGINVIPFDLAWNANSGGAAINTAYHLGARGKIILLGFDQAWTGGRSHHHGDHPKHLQHKKPGFHRWGPYFAAIANDAKKLGLDIVNCSASTTLMCFRRSTVEQEI